MARPERFESIYLDSCAFIAVIQGEAGCAPIKHVLQLADQQKLRVFASPLTLVEARGQGRGQQDPNVDQRARAILTGARLTLVEFTRGVALRARSYVGQRGLRPADAIHLASAVAAGVDVMWSTDSDFRDLRKSRIDGVWVDEPYEFGHPELEFEEDHD